MAGVEWSGCKCKGGTEAKGKMLHCDRAQRLKHGHDNPDIDLSKTPENFSYRGMTYGQKCKRYDEQVASAKVRRQSTGQNKNTTMIGLVVYLPKGLQKDGVYDPKVVMAWFRDVGDILNTRYGDDFVDMDVHVDEIHPYIDAKTKQWVWSLVHGHAFVVPTVTEDGERYLNGKRFASRAAINSLNTAIHEMSIQKYHVPYMDGRGKSGNATVPQLKAQSAKLLMERESELPAKEQQLKETAEKQAKVGSIQRKNKDVLDRGMQDLREKQSEMRQREGAISEQEAALAAQRSSVDAQQRAQDEREKKFQEWQDALDAQQRAQDEREKKFQEWQDALDAQQRAQDEREQKNQELILLGRRAKAAGLSADVQSTEHPERRLPSVGFQE